MMKNRILYPFLWLAAFVYYYTKWMHTKLKTLVYGEEVKPPSALDIYVSKNKEKFIQSFKVITSQNVNANIHPDIYDKKAFAKLLGDSDNNEEQAWKHRILYQALPREDGQIIHTMMYYDLYKQGFAYYAAQNSVPYKALNAMAMKYSLTFMCRDFFMDELAFSKDDELELHIPLYKSFIEEEKPKKEEKNKNVFAKLKNYQTATSASTKKDDKPKDQNQKQKQYVQNKFINMGKSYNFNVLQPIKMKKKDAAPTSYDGLFDDKPMSYKDYKTKLLNAQPTE